ncbi:RHS repeat-associated core domain-containing protein [Lentisphaerae bacterium WC36]|nr:RHS repeat-associated core domain-containing protein [Lentisphaerae bacterium WC36]
MTLLVRLTNSAIINKYDYGPFGQLAKTDENVENAFKFSSEYAEKETGLIYYNYRYYNPSTGKWLKRDPIQEKGGVNLYVILGADPLNYSDLYGLKEVSEEKNKEKCKVVLLWGHNGDVQDGIEKFDKNKDKCSCVGGVACYTDGRNGIKGMPNCAGGLVGTDPGCSNGGYYEKYKKQYPNDSEAKALHSSFTRLMMQAWFATLNKAYKMSQNCDCDCKNISVEFRVSSKYKGVALDYRYRGDRPKSDKNGKIVEGEYEYQGQNRYKKYYYNEEGKRAEWDGKTPCGKHKPSFPSPYYDKKGQQKNKYPKILPLNNDKFSFPCKNK